MRTWLLMATALLVMSGSMAHGQYIPIRIVGEGEPSPDTGDNIVTLAGQHNVTSTGEVAVEFDDAGPTATDDFFWVNGSALFRAGTMVTGGLSPSDFVDNFDTYTQLNDNLDLVWVGDDSNGDFLALNGDGLLFDGDAAPGIAGRVLNDFNEACIDAAGNIYFRADLDGTTADDEVIYFIPVGGAAVPLDLGVGGGIFQEGQLIIGGPLDAMSWDDAGTFVGLECSDSGVLLMEADIETSTEVLVRKQPGMAYELLLSEGDMFMAAAGMAPIENINQISQARGNLNWAVDAKFDDSITGTTADDVVLADVGGGTVIVAEEGADISVITGITGTTFGFLSQVSVNTAGQIIFLADIQDDGTNIPPYDEAIFLWDTGVTSLVITDEVPIPGSANLLTNLELDLYINDQGRIFFQGDDGTADTVFEAVIPAVFGVENIACAGSGAGDQVTATWTIPAGPTYDGIRIFENGTLAATLGATDTSYTTAVVAMSQNITIEVEPFIGADDAARGSCSAAAILPPTATECRTPMPPLPIDSANPPQTDILTAVTAVPLSDLSLQLNITHTFQADLDIDVTSPLGTNVVLTTDNGGGNDNVDILFADFGGPIPGDLSTGVAAMPEGPGTMADFQCENSAGDWVLGYDDDAGGDTGTLDMWCLNFYEETMPALNCCPSPSDLSCGNIGACGGPGVNVTWTNNSTYSLLELTRDDGMVQTTIALNPTDTSFSDATAVVGTSYTYTLIYQCAVGGNIQDAGSCSVTVDNETPSVSDVVCVPDFCGGILAISWNDNGVTYDSLELQRGGVFLADVTGLTSFDDMAPLAGTATYTLVSECGGMTSSESCSVDNVLAGVSNLLCDLDNTLCDGVVTLTWDNNSAYDSIDILVDGALIAPAPAPTDTTATLNLSAGPHTIEVVATCLGGSETTSCDVTVFEAAAGQTDCILALEGVKDGGNFGNIDSAGALATALVANGRTVYVTSPTNDVDDFVTGLPCGVDLSSFETIWVMAGTFTEDYRLNQAEGDLLASLASMGIGIYLEAADHWGFQHVDSLLDERDGIEPDDNDNIPDGDDTFTQMDGQAAPIAGLDLSANVDVNYIQDDLTGSDFTDVLSLTGTNMAVAPDVNVTSAEAIWLNSEDMIPAGDADDAIPYITGVIAIHMDGGVMISQSWEFGGYDGDQTLLAGAYLSALGRTSTGPQFQRGDCNDDNMFNIADSITVLGFLFPPPGGMPTNLVCDDSCDANDDGTLNIADAVTMLGFLFPQGPPADLPDPFQVCGEDPTPEMPTELGCDAYTSCP